MSLIFLYSVESAEKTKENSQANDNTHEEIERLMNADDVANGKNYKCMLKVLNNKHLKDIYNKTKKIQIVWNTLLKIIKDFYKRSMFLKKKKIHWKRFFSLK